MSWDFLVVTDRVASSRLLTALVSAVWPFRCSFSCCHELFVSLAFQHMSMSASCFASPPSQCKQAMACTQPSSALCCPCFDQATTYYRRSHLSIASCPSLGGLFSFEALDQSQNPARCRPWSHASFSALSTFPHSYSAAPQHSALWAALRSARWRLLAARARRILLLGVAGVFDCCDQTGKVTSAWQKSASLV